MKRADLEKQLGKKIAGRMQQEPQSDRYGSGSAVVADKREQRERDKAAGLVPFAVKLPQSLVTRLQAVAVERSVALNELVADLLTSALEPPAAAARKASPATADERKPDDAPKARKSKSKESAA